MNLPPYGLCLPCRLREVRDGDTVVVSLPGSDRRLAIRLLNCWAPELATPEGRAAKHFLEALLELHPHNLSVFLPAPKDPERLLKGVVSFDRLVGHLFIGTDDTLSAIMVRNGHATATKAGS